MQNYVGVCYAIEFPTDTILWEHVLFFTPMQTSKNTITVRDMPVHEIVTISTLTSTVVRQYTVSLLIACTRDVGLPVIYAIQSLLL